MSSIIFSLLYSLEIHRTFLYKSSASLTYVLVERRLFLVLPTVYHTEGVFKKRPGEHCGESGRGVLAPNARRRHAVLLVVVFIRWTKRFPHNLLVPVLVPTRVLRETVLPTHVRSIRLILRTSLNLLYIIIIIIWTIVTFWFTLLGLS